MLAEVNRRIVFSGLFYEVFACGIVTILGIVDFADILPYGMDERRTLGREATGRPQTQVA